jgi:hypothetical protein
MRQCSNGIVISPTEDVDPFYYKLIPKKNIYTKFDSKLIDNVICGQDASNFLYNIRKTYSSNENPIEHRAFIVLDECLTSSDWKKNIPLRELIINGRHHNITVIIVSQHVEHIEPCVRSNFDYIFALNDDIQNSIKKIYNYYCGCFPTFDYFKTTYQELTKDYKSMVIVNKGVHENIQDKIFWYKVSNC